MCRAARSVSRSATFHPAMNAAADAGQSCGGAQPAIGSLSAREIEVIVIAAAGVERRAARRAHRAAFHILPNGHHVLASSAKNSWLVPLRHWPNLNGMIRECHMAIFAGVVHATALHPDGDNVAIRTVMGAARITVEIDSANFRTRGLHSRTHYRTRPCTSNTGPPQQFMSA